MRYFRATLIVASILVLLVSWPRYSPAQDNPTQDSPAQGRPTDGIPEGKLSVEGTVKNVAGSPVTNAKVTITSGKVHREAVSDSNGHFSVNGLGPGAASVVYEARGYTRLKEDGVPLANGVNLSNTLQEKRADSRWALLLLIPGLVGLSYCAWDERRDKGKNNKGIQASAGEGDQNMPPPKFDNHYFIAMLGGWVWAATLLALVLIAGVGTGGENSLYLFHLELPMDVYVPALGFVGALLFVLEIRRLYGREEPNGREGPTMNSKEGGENIPKPIEDIPKGKEFGMRVIMGPYVAIVVVGLLGKDLTSPAAKGALAFFSGLLVVMFLQWLVEEGQRTLGKLRIESNRRNLDERKWQLEKDMGNLVWARLREKGVNTVAEFAHLDNSALDKVAAEDLPLLSDNLKAFRDKARALLAMAS